MKKIPLILIIIIQLIVTSSAFSEECLNNIIKLNIIGDTLYSVILEDDWVCFPYYVFNFNKVKRMDVYNCLYEDIPTAINSMKELKELNIVKCIHINYNNLVANLKSNHITKLKISNNGIIEVPKGIDMLITLDELDLSNNQIEVVNENLLKVSNIESLNLTGNRIKAFETTENQLYNLKKLDLSNNNLINIPDGLKNLKGLKRLNLSYNQNLKLDEICDLIDYFDDLKLLLILDCKTDGIPKNIEKLKKVGTIIGHDIFTIDELKKLREMGINISIPKTDW